MYRWIVGLGQALFEVERPKVEWKRPRKKQREVYRPVVEALEGRIVPCGPGDPLEPLEPWCLDDPFGVPNNGHAEVDVSNYLEEGRAIAIQSVEGEERTLVAGWARPNGEGPEFAIARLCENGFLDNGTTTGNGGCGGTGFGRHVGSNPASGVAFNDFFDNAEIERVNAITIQQAESDACDDTGPTDKIIVAGRAAVNLEEPSEYVWGLMRFCDDGELDTDWGGRARDWIDHDEFPESLWNDAAGTVTINFGNIGDPELTSWMRRGEAFAVAVEATTQKIVVAGYAFMPMDSGSFIGGTTSHFAIARLDTDEACGADNWGCYDETFNSGMNDPDDGRVHFDGDPQTGATHLSIEDEVHGIQLVEIGEDQYVIVIAGQDKPYDEDDRDFYVAWIDFDGQGDVSGTPYDWATSVTFDTDDDDIAWDLVVTGDDKIVVGGATCFAACAASIDVGDVTPESDFALARLCFDGELDEGDCGGNAFGPLGDGKRTYPLGYTDVGFSLILQPQATGNPRILIGGYSAEDDEDPAFMSGARFTPDADEDDEDVEWFRSDFSGTYTGNDRGDQAWGLARQSNDRIVAGGFHTRGFASGGPDFAAIRLCKDPGEDEGCIDPESIPTPDGGGEGMGLAHFITMVAATLIPSESESFGNPLRTVAQVTGVAAFPASLLPGAVGESEAPSDSNVHEPIPTDRSTLDDLFELFRV